MNTIPTAQVPRKPASVLYYASVDVITGIADVSESTIVFYPENYAGVHELDRTHRLMLHDQVPDAMVPWIETHVIEPRLQRHGGCHAA